MTSEPSLTERYRNREAGRLPRPLAPFGEAFILTTALIVGVLLGAC
jgi:hypothetical protein